MKNKSKTPCYKPRPIRYETLTTVKPNIFKTNVIFSRKIYTDIFPLNGQKQTANKQLFKAF